jgi:hypothetical protein
MPSGINRWEGRHSREGGNPEEDWIPGQARNDKSHKIFVFMYRKSLAIKGSFLF